MLDYHVDEVSISLDSISKDLFEEIRVNGKFERAIEAIRLLNAEKEARGQDLPRVNLTPTFMRKNIEELPKFIDFARQFQIHVVQASPLQVYRRDWMDQSLLHYPGLTRKMALAAERRAEEQGVRFVNNLRMVYTNRGNRWTQFLRREEPIDFPTNPSDCRKPWCSLYVEPDGEVRPCCYQSPVYGNLFEEGFETIWNGANARQLRRPMITRNPPSLCRDCYEFNRHRPEIMIQIEANEEVASGT